MPFATLHGLYWLAANVAVDQPTVLLVDDVHWSDAPSLRFVAHLARRLDGLPLLLCIGTRPPEQSEHPALVTELLTDPAAVIVRPGALGLASIEILVRDVFGAEPAPEFSAACLAASGGNPLYVRALLITLASDGLAPDARAPRGSPEVGPEPVARAVSLRLARLPTDAAALARAIAVLGQGAELGLAATLAGIDAAAAGPAAAALVRSELLRVEPALDFAHPVVRAAVYETIGTLERADAHRRAAGLLAAGGADDEHVAAHLLRVPPAGDPFVVETLRHAAADVLARGASAEAAVYLRRALVEPPTADLRPRGAGRARLGRAQRRHARSPRAPARGDGHRHGRRPLRDRRARVRAHARLHGHAQRRDDRRAAGRHRARRRRTCGPARAGHRRPDQRLLDRAAVPAGGEGADRRRSATTSSRAATAAISSAPCSRTTSSAAGSTARGRAPSRRAPW